MSVVIPQRKYRGPLRLAAIRQAMCEADAVGDDGLFLAEQSARKAGFVHAADKMRSTLDAREGTVRCKACGEPLGSGGPVYSSDGYKYRRQCDVCSEHQRLKFLIKRHGEKAAHRLLNPREPRHGVLRQEDHGRWPWVRRGRNDYVLQRSWRHLAGKIPEDFMNGYIRASEERRREIDAVIAAERKRRPRS